MSGRETVTIWTDDDTEEEAPARFEVCPTCEGKGTQALHGIAITADDWRDWDADEREGYFRGDYDTPCEQCRGKRVVLVLDRSRATPEQIKAYDEQRDWEAEERAERRHEALMLGERD